MLKRGVLWDRQEGSEEDFVGEVLECRMARICLLENGQDKAVDEQFPWSYLYVVEALLCLGGQETIGFGADEVLHQESMEKRR